MTVPLLDVCSLSRVYPGRGGAGRHPVHALDDVSFQVGAGTIQGVVGESGCGKSTLARLVCALDRPTGGTVRFEGADLFAARDPGPLRRGFQMVFQDPYASLNPRHRVGRIVAEPLYLVVPAPSRAQKRERVEAVLRSVGLDPADAVRFPHEFSGGQRQRIAIARALAPRPRLLVADEAVSALDLSVQAQILNLLLDLRERDRLAVLFISHDLAAVAAVCDRIAVMRAGRIVEEGPADAVLDRPKDAYTRRLLAAAPSLDALIAAGC